MCVRVWGFPHSALTLFVGHYKGHLPAENHSSSAWVSWGSLDMAANAPKLDNDHNSICVWQWGLIRQRMATITFLTVTQLRAIIWLSNDQVQTVVITGFLRDVVRWTWLDSAVTSQRRITQLLSSQASWRDVHVECLGTAALSHVWSYAGTLRRNIPPQSQNVLVDWHFTLSQSTVTSRC